MWSLNESRWCQACARWWKLPNENGEDVTRAASDFVGASRSQMIGTKKNSAKSVRMSNRTLRASTALIRPS